MKDFNPYKSPIDTGDGQFDRSLLKRFLRACRWIAIAFVLLDLVAAVLISGSFNPADWAVAADRMCIHEIQKITCGGY